MAGSRAAPSCRWVRSCKGAELACSAGRCSWMRWSWEKIYPCAPDFSPLHCTWSTCATDGRLKGWKEACSFTGRCPQKARTLCAVVNGTKIQGLESGRGSVGAGGWSKREDNEGVCLNSGSAGCRFWKKNGKIHTGTTHCIKCGLLFNSAFPLCLRALFKFAARAFLLKCGTNEGFQRFLEWFFSIQSYFKIKFVLVPGHIPSAKKWGPGWVNSWPSTYCTKCPKYPQVFIFLESSN